uniref:Solute carrier organic anion transporter family member n=1 Tax=Ditylenchus dipsaci TaxID=166011 RepID=A0A915ECQ6_9BILA
MTSAIVSIEKQFQIPSKISGMMFLCLTWVERAIEQMDWCASNFLFPVETVSLNNTVFQTSIERDIRRFDVNTNSLNKFLAELSPEQKEGVRQRFPASSFFPAPNSAATKGLTNLVTHYEESWLSQFEYCDELDAKNETDVTCQAFYNFLSRHNSATKEDEYDPKHQMHQGCLLFLGVGRTMPFSLGLPLIDDNVRKKNLPIYFAGMFFIRIMGPVVGFMMGSFFNKFYYTGEAPRGITPRDPMWIGMWWGGFLVIGLVLFGPSLALFCFKAPQPEPEDDAEDSCLENGSVEDEKSRTNGKEKLLDAPLAVPEGGPKKPAKKKTRGLALVDRHVEKGADGSTVVPESLEDKIKDFAQTISTVIRQPVYAGTLAGRILDVMAFKGFFIFLPKYLELQFGIPQYKINAYMGVIGVVGFAIGILIGSVALKVWKLEGRKVAAYDVDQRLLPRDALPNNFNINSSCLSGCGCGGAPLYPCVTLEVLCIILPAMLAAVSMLCPSLLLTLNSHPHSPTVDVQAVIVYLGSFAKTLTANGK